MKEVYRSFEGKLNYDNPVGHIVYDDKNFYKIESLSAWSSGNLIMRISKNVPFDFKDDNKIGILYMDIFDGKYTTNDYQVFVRGKWYGGETINKIVNSHRDHNWTRYIK